jgi:Tn3 transposase DDE domain
LSTHDGKQDAFNAIAAVIPWERFRATVAEAEALTRPDEFDAYQMLGEHYAGVRRWAPAFLETFAFQSAPAAAALMRAIEALRDMNRMAKVARWTLFPDCFTHLRTGETAGNPQILMASLLADGLNLGLTPLEHLISTNL